MMFAILFGLSMDYEVFLVSRIREEYLKDRDTRRAVADGLAKTARVITAAAAIMIVVFLAFVASPEGLPEALRIGLAAAIFPRRDAGPDGAGAAVMQLLGHWNWWIPKLAGARPARGSTSSRERKSRSRKVRNSCLLSRLSSRSWGIARKSRLLEREDDLAALRGRSRGRPSAAAAVLLIEGPAGIGKTALVGELEARAGAAGQRV